MKKILLTGVAGQVGWELQRTLAPFGQIFALDSKSLDLSKPDDIRNRVREFNPDVIVNPAAFTAVDLAESQKDLCFAINGIAPGVFAEEAKRLNALLIHYSTDYVFDGSSSTPYFEDHPTNPLNTYGLSKLAGEQAILSVGANHLILRTSWVYGLRGKNFLLTMLKLAKEKEHLKIVSDQWGAPTWSRMIAQATAQMLASYTPAKSGRYNLVCSGKTSWSEFAEAIFEWNKQKNPEAKIPQITPISTSEYPAPAKRPLNSVLSLSKIERTFGIHMPDWKTALQLCMDERR